MRVPLLVIGLAVLTSNAHALTFIVPDDRPTIQAAINDGADSVRVRGGLYAEALEIKRSVVIVPFPAPIGFGYNAVALPRVAGLTIKESHSGTATVVIQGLRFTRPVILDRENGSSMYLTFESCRMDSGLVESATSVGYLGIVVLNVQGCTIMHGARARPYIANFTLNTFFGGGLDISGEGYSTVRGNFVHGPAAIGIRSRGESPEVEDNTVVGTVVGIDVSWHARRNEVLDCSGVGLRGLGGGSFSDNVVCRSGGNGIDVQGEGNGTTIDHNVVEASGGTGIRLGRGAIVTGNIVGHSAGPGISTEWGGTVTGNTCYSNQGAGFVTAYGEFERNIAFSNGGAGLQWSEYKPQLTCNDWFGNARGAVEGMTRNDGHPGPSDLAVDPLFCDVNAGDLHLAAGSPLLDALRCGLIGALGQGCPAVLKAVDEAGLEAGLEALSLRATPLPSADGVHLAWRPLSAPARLEVFDAMGARIWRRDLSAGETGLHWAGTDASGQRLPSGVYFARLTGSGAVTSTRVILTR